VSDGTFVLVTGAAGTIGRPLVSQLASMPWIEGVLALTHELPLTLAKPSVQVAAGDIAKDATLGLDPAVIEAVCGRITTIIHAAADTRFDSPKHDTWATNVEGTRHVLAFARRCPRLTRIIALSTTHVAGRRTGIILEEDLEHRAGFVNTYEAAKHEAERDLRAAMRELPLTVVRISSVTGASCITTGAQRSAIHQAVRCMYAGLAPMVPGREDSPVDIIDLDYVVRAIAWFATDGFAAGQTWHLCAGADTVPIGELLDLTVQEFLKHRPTWRKRAIERPMLVDLPTFELFCRSVEEAGDETLRASTAAISRFAPQLAFPKQFDDRRCRDALARSALIRPQAREVWSRMVQRLINWRQPEDSSLQSGILEFVRTSLLDGRTVSIDADTCLFEAGLIDSLMILQLIAFIETEIGRPISDRDVVMNNFRSVRAMAERFAVSSS
jgi:nucleoside-diphosphate-sugar epimerase/acyl carrier protein